MDHKCQRCGTRFDPAFGYAAARLCADCYLIVNGPPMMVKESRAEYTVNKRGRFRGRIRKQKA